MTPARLRSTHLDRTCADYGISKTFYMTRLSPVECLHIERTYEAGSALVTHADAHTLFVHGIERLLSSSCLCSFDFPRLQNILECSVEP